MSTVVVAGASGYLGTFLVSAYLARGWKVRALVRNAPRAEARGLAREQIVVADATDPESLRGTMEGATLVVSALGITRQRDGLSYRDVDYQANVHLLNEALAAGVPRFCYVHVMNARAMANVSLVAAKQAFVDVLRAAPLRSTVVCPSGYFSDMEDFLSMARSGRVWLFGSGTLRLNLIHGADLAEAVVDAVETGRETLEVGGTDTFTQQDLARLAFKALGKPPAISSLPDWIRRTVLRILPVATPRDIRGPAQFFLTAMGRDMVGDSYGNRHLAEHFRSVVTGIIEGVGR
ncbi:SDR family oxidoreductase [Tropicimonas marinistellae]|uniref:SDR family oxidoreductase n=1 Tax=Tropicimonas marinistellae TaxID=1739787 RepID=UPI00082DEAD0|nr:SDR family oxidoreductase [Tropicimonas marinistellae]